jgi:hypothetical protein
MKSMIQEFVDSRGIALRIDRENGVLHGVKILGGQSRNRRSYPPSTLEKAVPLYENARVYVNHAGEDPSRPRRYQDRIGSIRNVSYRRGQGLYADLHFNPRHAVAEQLFWDAEHAPEHVGFSHHVEAEVVREEKKSVVRRICTVRSVDLVSDPATTRGLFEASETDHSLPAEMMELTEEALRRERADLVESIEAPSKREVATLREKLQGLENSLARKEHEIRVYRLMHEYRRSAEEEVRTPSDMRLWSRPFIDVLMETKDEKQVRNLIEDRMALCESLAKEGGSSGPPRHPISREQSPGRPAEVNDRREFLAKIT